MIKIDENYSDYREDDDPDFPFGKAVSVSGSNKIDGTPWRKELFNDLIGARQAIFKQAFGSSKQPSNVPDNVTNSDILKALQKIIDDKVSEGVENGTEYLWEKVYELEDSLVDNSSGFVLSKLCAGEGRDLRGVLGYSTVKQAAAELKRRADAKNYKGLLLGDYLDITSEYEGTFYTVRYEIVAFNHYNAFYNGNNLVYGLGSITFCARDIVYKRRFNAGIAVEDARYSTSEMRNALNGSVYTSLKNALGVELKKISIQQWYNRGSNQNPDMWPDYEMDYGDYVYLPSSREILGEKGYGSLYDNSHQFTAFALSAGKIPAKDNTGKYCDYFLRTPAIKNPFESYCVGSVCTIEPSGKGDWYDPFAEQYGVRPVFNI